MKPVRLVTYNIHKGLSALNRHFIVPSLAQALLELKPDIVCLQEVQGEHLRRARRFHNWPTLPQADYVAHHIGLHAVYGAHAQFNWGHHGNAILGRWRWAQQATESLTLHRFEQRGLVHGVCHPSGWSRPLHIVSCHLNLLQRHRHRQLLQLVQYVERCVPENATLLLAGDFNDWRMQASEILAQAGLIDACQACLGHPARTFPARLPFLPLDRIYARGLTLRRARVIQGMPWLTLSDHLPLLVDCTPA